jgi:four helix bundle protein
LAQISSYRDLSVWQKAMNLVVDCHRLSDDFPRDENFALKIQLRRAAVSIPSNIAEGHGRTGVPGYLHHLSIAHGSLMELETHLQIAMRLEYLAQQQVDDALGEAAEISRPHAASARDR